jgi:hypothetical protein
LILVLNFSLEQIHFDSFFRIYSMNFQPRPINNNKYARDIKLFADEELAKLVEDSGFITSYTELGLTVNNSIEAIIRNKAKSIGILVLSNLDKKLDRSFVIIVLIII